MQVTDFVQLNTHYTGGHNKRKWAITNPNILEEYLKKFNYKPSLLAKELKISYATLKRFLFLAKLWNLASVKKQNGKTTGRKRKATQDRFGYEIADKKYDIMSPTGEVYRRFIHHVVAEQKYGRKLSSKENVHHIDCNKKNNSPDNLIICEDNSVHRKLHGQLERVAGQAVALGLIKFNEQDGYYINPEFINETNKS